MKLSKNTILITGGTRGIGLEFARALMRLENTVIVTGRDENRIKEIKNELPGIHAFKADVTNKSDVEKLCRTISKEFPSLNILINNAGIGKTINLQIEHDDSLTEELRTNLEAPIHFCNVFLPFLMKQQSAAIINITSALAFIPFPLVPIYSASKAGFHSYTQSLRAQLRRSNVKVFEVAPPSTQTDMLAGFSKGVVKNSDALSAEMLVELSLTEIEKDNFEVCPGKTKHIRLLARFAPRYLAGKMEKGLSFQKSHGQ